VWMFFAHSLSHPEWLRDQKYNAWSYGWDFRAWRRHLKLALTMFIPMLLLMLVFAFLTPQGAQARFYYRSYFLPPVGDARSLLYLLGSLTVYMLCWEWFFRGFLLFGMAQGFGPIIAMLLQAVIFGAAHCGKPPAEMYSAFGGGLILGAVAWRERSFVPAFYTHALVHIAWIILVLF
jgi:membrane protease YdiL (CAAX protease family)